ncbi:hypothetical protein M569_09242 [Genlisea aurea]|uniref:Pentacotripeptide-repeat region of PRORP domain-containing protein n=1 Tax=Genlisea aurea TaxID=192259 RepID=S8CL98_9LAMI|nr:hypothetical protein M569_09242 [Genlisea aurea]
MRKGLLSAAKPAFIFPKFSGRYLRSLISQTETGDWIAPPKHFSPKDYEFLKESVSPAKETTSKSLSDDVSSIVTAIREYDDGLGEESQNFLRRFRSKLHNNLVVDVIRNIHNPELGVKFFMWAGRQIGYNHSVAVYDALLELLTRNKIERVADHFLLEISNDDVQVLGKLLNLLIRKYCYNGMWNLALEELGRLKSSGCKPSKVTYNALLRIFLEAGKLDAASLLHKEMIHLGFKMDEHVLHRFVRFLCKIGKWTDALNLVEKEGVQPDTVLYTNMIAGLCEASHFEEAMEFLNKMRANSCLPNVVTYRTLLCGCLNKGKLGRCKRILNMMIAEGCFPDHKIFCSLVHAFCKSKDHSYAYKLFRKMEDSAIKPGYVVYNIFIGSICGCEEFPDSGNLELADRAYRDMLEAGFALNRVNTTNFARCLCIAGKYDRAYNVIREMMGNGFVPDAGTYNNVISFLCDGSKVDKALLLFQDMKKQGIVANVYTYSILIDRFCKAGLLAQARCWFEEMRKDGCIPNVVTYTAIVHAYLKARKINEANEVFEMMLAQGCQPNVVTFTALIDGYCKSGDVERASAIYERMRGNNADVFDVGIYFRISGDADNEPNAVTFGALIDGFCKSHKINEARDLFDVMKRQGPSPNHVIYDALIDGFCKAGRIDEAEEVFVMMSECGYSPNIYTYGSLIDRMFKDQRLDLALKLLSKMLDNSCPPNVVIYTAMIDGLCKVGKVSEAHKLMLMMEEKGCKPNVVTYTAMIDGFGRDGDVDKSLGLFRKMVDEGCPPNHVTYSVMIRRCSECGKLDEAYRLLEEMKRTHWPSFRGNYRNVVEGFSKEFMLSQRVVEEMDPVAVVPLYVALMDSFRKAGRLETAFKLHKEMVPLSYGDGDAHSSLIRSLSCCGKVEMALEVYADVSGKGVMVEFGACAELVKGLMKVDRWEDAFMLCERLAMFGKN